MFYSLHIHYGINVLSELGYSLSRNLCEAMEFHDRQHMIFSELDTSLDSTITRQWQTMIDTWEADSTKPNPYEELEIGMSVHLDYS